MSEPAILSDSLVAWLSKRGKLAYSATLEDCPYYGRVVVLSGSRGARYVSIPYARGYAHSFIDRAVEGLVVRVVGNIVTLATETLPCS